MTTSMLLDLDNWDFVIDSFGNWAVCTAPYAYAQDAACAIRLFLSELWYDTTQGIEYRQTILAKGPPLSLVKAYWNAIAKTVPGVVSATSYIASFVNRTLSGQVQITNKAGETSASGF